MEFFQGPLPSHFAILQAKIGLKMAELDCFQNCSIWIIKKGQNLKELQGAPLAKSGALNFFTLRHMNLFQNKNFKVKYEKSTNENNQYIFLQLCRISSQSITNSFPIECQLYAINI